MASNLDLFLFFGKEPMADQEISDPRSRIYEEKRPWGGFRRYTHNELSTVKVITVKPGEVLSLQYHHHRDELWVALDPGLRVTMDFHSPRNTPSHGWHGQSAQPLAGDFFWRV